MLSTVLTAASLVLAVSGQANSYAPTRITCPDNLVTRTGNPLNGTQVLGANETAYLDNRRENVLPNLYYSYLGDNSTGSTGYNATALFASGVPKTGIACSGGGLRASLFCAGTLSALDSRNTSSSAGGLLQLADYLTGLSGGSWAVSSIAMNDLPPIYDLVLGNASSTATPGWILSNSILDPGGLLHPIDDVEYIDQLLDDSQQKEDVVSVSISDVWGRALSFHFWNSTTEDNFFDFSTNDTNHDAGLLFHSIRLTQNFQAGAMPYPIIVTTSRVNVSVQDDTVSPFGVIPLSNTQFEISPYTFGSFDPTLAAHIPTEYAGASLNGGTPVNTTSCLSGFDNAGFMIASSASLFNSIQTLGGTDDADLVATLDTIVGDLAGIEGTSNDSVSLVANWPNSFQGWNPQTLSNYTFESQHNTILEITDGGEDGQNVPIYPLLVKQRALDFILATDASADTDYLWPNGTSMVATAQRSVLLANWSSFPPIPSSMDQFVAQGLNTRPVFFGCDVNDSLADPSQLGAYPLVAYLANSLAPGTTYQTNVSTYTLEYSDADASSFLDAAHANALKGFTNTSSTAVDAEWPLCLKCAVVDRLRQRQGIARSGECGTCFARYCWTADTVVNANGSSGATTASNMTGTTSAGDNASSGAGHVSRAGLVSFGAMLVAGAFAVLA